MAETPDPFDGIPNADDREYDYFPRTAGHHTHIGQRTVRDAEGGFPHMPFARCSCGWEGPSRLKRGAAVQDGLDHCSETVDRRE